MNKEIIRKWLGAVDVQEFAETLYKLDSGNHYKDESERVRNYWECTSQDILTHLKTIAGE